MCVYCVENVSTASTYIALNALEILMPYVNSVDVTFIERSVHFLHFKLMSQEPMSLFSVACLTNSSSHTSLK